MTPDIPTLDGDLPSAPINATLELPDMPDVLPTEQGAAAIVIILLGFIAKLEGNAQVAAIIALAAIAVAAIVTHGHVRRARAELAGTLAAATIADPE